VDKKHDIPAEARNLVFMSSLAMNGEGRGIVIRTGGRGRVLACVARHVQLQLGVHGPARRARRHVAHTHAADARPPNTSRCVPHGGVAGDETMIGKIASLATGTATHRSTLQVEVHRLVLFVGALSFTVAMILFVVGLIRKLDPLQAFVNGFILVVVANVPEVRVGWCRGVVGGSSWWACACARAQCAMQPGRHTTPLDTWLMTHTHTHRVRLPCAVTCHRACPPRSRRCWR
jgi:hypothetical protein